DVGRGPEANLFGISFDQQALEATDQPDDEAEHWGLDQADPQVGDGDDLLQPLDKGQRRDSQVNPDVNSAAEDRHDHGIEGQERHHDHRRHHPGNDQSLNRRYANGAHGVDFLGQLHRPELGGERAPRPAGDHDGGHQRAELAHGDATDEVDRIDFGAELAELDGTLLADDDANQKAPQANNAERTNADQVETLDDRVQSKALLGPLEDIPEAEERRAEEVEQAVEDLASLDYIFAELGHRPSESGPFLFGNDAGRLVGQADLLQQALDIFIPALDLGAAV